MKKIIKIFLMFAFIVVTYNVVSNAAISATSKTINSGENVSILVTSNIQLSAYTVKVTGYNGLTFVTSSGGSGAGTTCVSDAKATGGMTSLATFQFKAPSIEKDQTYQVTFSATGMGDINLNSLPDSSCTANITVKGSNPNTGDTTNNGQTTTNPEKPSTSTKSSNANVKRITTSPVNFSGFKTNKTSGYAVTVENNVDKINVNVSKEDSKASVSLLNKTNSDKGKFWVYLAEGNNEINIVVTSEDGTNQKTYTINVTRKTKDEQTEETEKPEEKPEEAPEENSEEQPMEGTFGLSELKIEGLELNPKFQTDIYEYNIELKEDLEKLNITTLATKENSNIEITGNENLQEGENIITIIVKGENDAETVAYQIIVNKILEKQEDTSNREQQEKIKKIIILSVAGGIILIIAISVVIIKIKKSKGLNAGYIPYEDLNDDYEETNEVEDQQNEDVEDEFYEEETRKKKHSKGKRFK